jgi:hypothetical protein
MIEQHEPTKTLHRKVMIEQHEPTKNHHLILRYISLSVFIQLLFDIFFLL